MDEKSAYTYLKRYPHGWLVMATIVIPILLIIVIEMTAKSWS